MTRHLDASLLRHIVACRNATLPGGRLEFHLADRPVGWVMPEFAGRLLAAGCHAVPGGIRLDEAAALPDLAARLAAEGACGWRGEAFDVRAAPGGPVLATIDRGALPAFGIAAEGAHVNGLVQRPDGPHLWVARRALDKRLDPGKLDHIVAGGVPAGLTPWQTLIKEAEEEADVPATLAARAAPMATIDYVMSRPEGLRRDRLHVFDLTLPASFQPRPRDGEVAGFELWPVARAVETARATDAFKFNVSLVLIDLFLRTGAVDPAGAEGVELRAALGARDQPSGAPAAIGMSRLSPPG